MSVEAVRVDANDEGCELDIVGEEMGAFIFEETRPRGDRENGVVWLICTGRGSGWFDIASRLSCGNSLAGFSGVGLLAWRLGDTRLNGRVVIV